VRAEGARGVAAAGKGTQSPPRAATGEVRRRVLVREATPRDLVAAAKIVEELDAHHARLQPEFFQAAPHGVRARLEPAVASPDQLLLVAEARGGDGIVGLVHVRLFDTPSDPLLAQRRRGYVELLAVTRENRRTGIGRVLMQAASEWCRRRGATQILLTIWEGNDDALAFYRSLGLRPVSQVLGTRL
jgi:diamine N-acetyltransferase